MLSFVLAQILVISGAQWVPEDPALAPRIVTLLIEGEKIREVGEGLAVPAGAREIDGRGLFLCAAPIDGFAYWDQAHDALYASAGIAILCDHGNSVLQVLEAKASTARAGFPTLRIAGPVIDGFPPSTTNASVARTAVEAQAQIEPLFAEGIDFVAFQSNLTAEPWRKLIEVAHANHRQVWGPLPRGIGWSDALDTGQDGLLFFDALMPQGRAWDSVTIAEFEPAIAKLGEKRARIVPFLNGNARLLAANTAQSPELDSLSPEFANYWRSELAARVAMFKDDMAKVDFMNRGRKAVATQRELLVKLHASGAQLVPGSGAPHPWLFPGTGLHDELSLWQSAGLAPREILRLATLGAARALGIEAERGSIEVGKYADLVLLAADPSKDIAALRKPEWVVLRGQASSRADLDAALGRLRERQLRAQADATRPIEVGDPPKVAGELVLAGYCETSALGVRSAAERYTIVRAADGKLSFCGMRVVPQVDGSHVEIESLMRVAKGSLEYFLLRLRSAKHELSVEGFYTANQMRVERKVDGVHVDLQTSSNPVSVVDVGSVTSLLCIAATQNGGPFSVMEFHAGLELEVVRWDLRLERDGAHYLRTPEGVKWARFDERGALKELSEQRGSSGVKTLGTNTLAKDRAGLPFSAAKQSAIEAAQKEYEAKLEAAKQAGGQPAAPKSGGER